MLKLAVRNLLRQKARSMATLSAIAFGVVSLVLASGFMRDTYLQLAEALTRSHYGHLQVGRPGFFEHGSRRPEAFLIDEPRAIAEQLATLPRVDDVFARVNFSGLISNGREDLAIVGEGIEPSHEARLGTYLSIKAGRQLEDADVDGILVGSGVARSLNLKPSDRVTLLVSAAGGALNTLDFEVIGVFQTFSKDLDDRAVRVPLPAAQMLLDANGVNTLVLSLKETSATAEVADSLRQLLDVDKFEVKTWFELADFYEKTVALYERQFGVFRLIILFLVLLSVANSVGMTTMERVGEFGTMMALGSRRLNTFCLIVAESTFLGLAGGTVGIVLGVALAAAISAVGIPMPPPPNSDLGYTASIQIVPMEIALAFAVGVFAAVGASILPALRAMRTPVVDALRRNT